MPTAPIASTRPVWLIAPESECADTDQRRARSLGVTTVDRVPEQGFFIARDAHGLCLRHSKAEPGETGLHSALSEYHSGSGRHAGGRKSPLARALGLHRHPPMRVLDTTGGLGRDATVLASLGCEITVIERRTALYALLAEATETIDASPQQPGWWPNWHPPIHADARTWLAMHGTERAFDVIYIDPMFASPRRKSRPQKALVWLAELAGEDADAPLLIAEARKHAQTRVVVKQHARAEPMTPPDLRVHGRAIRFDIYLTARPG